MNPFAMLAIVGGALLGLLSFRNEVAENADMGASAEIEALKSKLDTALQELRQAKEGGATTADVEAIKSEAKELRTELEGLKAGEAARKKAAREKRKAEKAAQKAEEETDE